MLGVQLLDQTELRAGDGVGERLRVAIGRRLSRGGRARTDKHRAPQRSGGKLATIQSTGHGQDRSQRVKCNRLASLRWMSRPNIADYGVRTTPAEFVEPTGSCRWVDAPWLAPTLGSLSPAVSQPRQVRMSQPEPSSNPRSELPPNESLPPVEPPSPGFLIQLFVIPAVIVTIIVLVWTMFTWLAQKGNDVDSYLLALRRDNAARWQAAVGLADLVRTSRGDVIRSDPKVAQQLQEILQQDLDAGHTDETSLKLRSYLCNTLGEFRVPNVLPVLITAATSGKSDEEKAVRFAALKSIAVYVETNPDERAAHADKILAAIDQAAGDDKPLLRSTAAFAYSALDTEPARAGVLRLLQDTTADVRFNAALMLARRGDSRAIDVLVEMLDPALTLPTPTKDDEKAAPLVKTSIQMNALRSIVTLKQLTPEQQNTLLTALDKLSPTTLAPAVQGQLTTTRAHLTSLAAKN